MEAGVAAVARSEAVVVAASFDDHSGLHAGGQTGTSHGGRGVGKCGAGGRREGVAGGGGETGGQ